MDTTVRDYATIAITLLLFAVFMTAITYAGAMGYELLGLAQDKRGLQKELVAQRDIAVYNDTVVTHDDIILATKKYKRQYRILVQPFESYEDLNVGLKVDTHDYYLTELDSDSSWGSKSIDDSLTILENHASLDTVRYSSKLIKDENTGLITTLLFTKQ